MNAAVLKLRRAARGKAREMAFAKTQRPLLPAPDRPIVRPRLICRWYRSEDGRLACRWEPDVPPDSRRRSVAVPATRRAA